jgi:hypothetical protein
MTDSDPDPEGPKTFGSGSTTLVLILNNVYVIKRPFVQMLSSLFEASAGLSEESLQHMVQALITISGESLQLAYNNREPSLFAIAKLLETGQVGFFSTV